MSEKKESEIRDNSEKTGTAGEVNEKEKMPVSDEGKKDKKIKIKENWEKLIVKSKLNEMTVEGLKKIHTLKGVIITEAVIIVLMFVYNAVLMMRPKQEIGYIVEMNALTGEQRKIEGAVKELKEYTTPENIIMNTVRTYIEKLRSVSNDNGVNQSNIKWVYSFTTEKAKNYIDNFYNEHNPISRVNDTGEKVEVVIYNSTPVSSAEGMKFSVLWNEKVRDSYGKFVREQNYRADVDMKQFKVTKQTAELNPVGVYVTNIYISEIKDITSGIY